MSKTERLIGLTMALLDAARPLTLAQLRERTGYYDQDDPESARRMFERDKDDLRRLGVPVETREPAGTAEAHGYLIERDRYELDAVDLTRDEVAALAVAMRLADPGAARLAATRLAARAPDPLGRQPAPTARVSVAPDRVDQLAGPLLERRPVSFDYRTATGDHGRRTVDPYAVVSRRGSWYLVGRDHDRGALRAFRVDRMTGRPTAAGPPEAFEVPADLDPHEAVSGPRDHEIEATVAVAPEARWQAERRGGVATGREEDGWPVYRFRDLPRRELRAWVISAAAEAELLTPAGEREAVVAHLESVLA